MSIRYASNSTLNVGRGPKGSQAAPWFRRRATSRSTSYTAISVTLGAVANTKGSWSQVVASTSGTVGMVRLRAMNYANAVAHATLLDIGIGAAGSEVVVVPNVTVGGGGAPNAFGGLIIDIPVSIPAGTRVAVRAQSQRTSYSFSINVVLLSALDAATTPTSLDTLGVSTATSSGTAMSGASGTYVQITSATTRDYQGLIVVPAIAANGTLSGTATVTFTLAVGAAGAEVDYTTCVLATDGGIGVHNNILPSLFAGGLVPAGSRIAVKHTIASSPGNLAACVIGVPYV